MQYYKYIWFIKQKHVHYKVSCKYRFLQDTLPKYLVLCKSHVESEHINTLKALLSTHPPPFSIIERSKLIAVHT